MTEDGRISIYPPEGETNDSSTNVSRTQEGTPATPKKRRGRPPKVKAAPAPAAASDAAMLPAALAGDVPDSDAEALAGVSVVETYFNAFGSRSLPEPGVGVHNLVLDAKMYVKDVPKDHEGRDLVDFRFGSSRPGCPEHNGLKGFVPALVDPVTQKLSPTGKAVTIGGAVAGARSMQLLVRERRFAEASASAKEKYAKNHTKTFKSMSADYAQKLGLADNLVTTRDDERELVVGGKED
jgi:hypothetical protein